LQLLFQWWERHVRVVCAFYVIFPLFVYSGFLFSEAGLIPMCMEGAEGFNHYAIDVNFYFEKMAFALFALIPVDFILMPTCFIINVLSIRSFLSQRKTNRQSEQTVERYKANFLIIAVGEFTIQAVCVLSGERICSIYKTSKNVCNEKQTFFDRCKLSIVTTRFFQM
jgi:hypothetical protein